MISERTMAAIALAALLLWGAAGAAFGGQIFVDGDAPGDGDGSSWATAFNYLRDALSAASSGDEIRVAQGVYTPHLRANRSPGGRGSSFRLVNSVTIRGGYAGFGEPVPDARNVTRYETVLSGDLSGNDVELSDPADLLGEPTRSDNCYNVVTGTDCDEATVLDGFTITGGNADRIERSRDSYGGGLHDGNLRVIGCRIVGNSAVQGGGGVGCYGGAAIEDSTISGNSARFGGGLYGVRRIINCTVTGNSTSQYGGGGIYILNDDGEVSDCTIRNNSTPQHGGGVYIEHCDPKFARCTIVGNSASRNGGGVYVDGSTSGGAPAFERCRIVGNSAGYGGGGLHNSGYSFSKLTSCVFTGNHSGEDGGGMCDSLNGGSLLVNCTFANNTTAGRGGGICYDSDPNMGRVITNCILWHNSDSYGQAGQESQVHIDSGSVAPSFRYCCIQGWTGDMGGPGQVGTTGANPLFVDSDGVDNIAGTEDDNLRLQGGSPCIDGGDNSAVTQPAEDLDGKVRIIHGIVDIGAYESEEGSQHVLPRYEVIDIGGLGGSNSWATGINEAGQVAGYAETAAGEQHAFIWDENIGTIDLGTLGGNQSKAFGINNLGQVAGSAKTGSGELHAFLWEKGRMTDLGVLEGGSCTEAKAINDAGQVVGEARTSQGNSSWQRAFLWENDAMADLRVLAGATASSASDINIRGHVVGTSSERAFLWDSTNGMTDLMGAQSWGNAINDAGQMALHSSEKYYIRDITSGLFDMYLIKYSRINAINNAGQVVGDFDYLSVNDVHAFLWDSSYGMVDLNGLIPAGSGFNELRSAGDISDGGRIVGYGLTDGGAEHAFVMTPIPAEAYLAAHWKLDEASGNTAEDSVGDNDGTLLGGPQWQPYSGRVDGALGFDGSGDYVNCGNGESLNITGDITVAAWVKINAVSSQWQSIVTKGDSAWRLSTANDEMKFHFAVTGGPPWNFVSGDTEVGANEWRHVCGTYDGANMRLYVDGVEDPASPVAEINGVQKNTYDVFIGANQEMSGRYWDGLIDDVRLYSCPLTSMEVYELYMEAPIYVDGDAPPGPNDGLSWQSAFHYVQDGLAAAVNGNRIHVAQGVYRPDNGAGVAHGDRGATFELIDGVTLRGGFAGYGQPDPKVRDISRYESTLSGDLGENDSNEWTGYDENSYNVVTGSGTNSTAVLEGFTVTGGNADRVGGGGMRNRSGSPTVSYCAFKANLAGQGGGMYNELASPTITDTIFTGNMAFLQDAADDPRGGGMYNYKSSPMLSNCVFADNSVAAETGEGGEGGGLFSGESSATLVNCIIRSNSARKYGGGMANRWGGGSLLVNCLFNSNSAGDEGGGLANFEGDSVLTNCTFSGNSATSTGGVYNKNGDPMLANCILWGNRDSGADAESAQIRSVSGTLVIEYSCVRGWSGILGGAGNIGTDPSFEDVNGADDTAGTEDDDLRPATDSPCIDAGENAVLLPFVITDLGGNPRVFHGVVDMGAYEFQNVLRWYVDGANGDDTNNGLSPGAAFATIQKGITSARKGYTVVVYPGVYEEEIFYGGKAVTVTGQGSAATILEAPGGYAVSFFSGEDANSVLKNVVIRNCTIGILVQTSSPKITNVTVVNNNDGIVKYLWGEPDISNCIFWNNANNDLVNCEAWYSCLPGGDASRGNISADPLFADAPGGDYHLLSERGRYRATTKEWILDDVTSPCVDGGDPAVKPSEERMPNGGRLNMGAFGGIYYASMSEWKIVGDVNRDGKVNMADFTIVAENWLSAAQWAL